ncbi:DUF6093 family protein [Ornithinimicrobium sp. LYQ92]|uniref:DUF6093 family protein n=1 Tax=Serinicoccus sp. LYQ92 TaxID=3378798 RepID=UPI0038540FD2
MFDVEGIRDRARHAAEQRLLDVVEVTVDNPHPGEPVRDPVTGEVTYPSPRVIIYGPTVEPHRGKARVRMANASASVMQGPDGQVALTLSSVVVPADVVLRKGADVRVVVSDNPAAVGVSRTIRAVHTGSQQSTNRYGFEEVN